MEQIAACDIRDILNFERQIEAPSIILTPSSEEMSRLAQTFTSHWGHNRINDRKENPEDHFTVLETTVLGLMTHCDTYDDMAMLLGASGSTLSRMLSRVAEEYGAQTQVDLMLVGISAGAASVAHVPAGRTEGISSRHLSFLQRYFSNDPMERNSARSIPTSTIGSNFKRAADSIGVKGAKELVKCLVRDGRIDLPIMPQSRFDIDRETTTPRTTLASGRLLVMHTERYIRQDGRIKILPEIPFNILSLLAKHADKVVGMPEMRNHVWPDEAIDHRNPQGRQYNQVATGLSQLRGALDRTDLGHPRTGVIRNIYGEGWMAQSQLP
jgi:DNA-binding winged helix-turn-helix (wHTH) protein